MAINRVHDPPEYTVAKIAARGTCEINQAYNNNKFGSTRTPGVQRKVYLAVTTGSGSSHLPRSLPEQIILHDNSNEVMVYGACDARGCRCSPILSALPKRTRNETLHLNGKLTIVAAIETETDLNYAPSNEQICS